MQALGHDMAVYFHAYAIYFTIKVAQSKTDMNKSQSTITGNYLKQNLIMMINK